MFDFRESILITYQFEPAILAYSPPGIPCVQLKSIIGPLMVDADAVLDPHFRLLVAQLGRHFWEDLVVESGR